MVFRYGYATMFELRTGNHAIYSRMSTGADVNKVADLEAIQFNTVTHTSLFLPLSLSLHVWLFDHTFEVY